MADLRLVTVDPAAYMARTPQMIQGNPTLQGIQAGHEQARRDAREDRVEEDRQYQAGLKAFELAANGQIDAARHVAQVSGVEIPDQALQDGMLSRGFVEAHRFGYTTDPVQAATFAKAYRQSGGNPEAAFQAAGAPKQKAGPATIKAGPGGALYSIVASPDGTAKVNPITGPDGKPFVQHRPPPQYGPDRRNPVAVRDPSDPNRTIYVHPSKAEGMEPAPRLVRPATDPLVKAQGDDGVVRWVPRSQAGGMAAPTAGGAGGRDSVFEQKRRAWLETHPGDTQGALDFAGGRARLDPAKARATARQMALKELSGGFRQPKPEDIDRRAEQIFQSITQAAGPAMAAPAGPMADGTPSPAAQPQAASGLSFRGYSAEGYAIWEDAAGNQFIDDGEDN